MHLYVLLFLLMIHTSLYVSQAVSSEFPYDLDKPDVLYTLPDVLKEASAISYINDKEVAMLHDERGYIYIFSLVNNEINERIKFSGKGDFEGLSIVNSTAYALKSNGVIYEIRNYRSKNLEKKKIRTVLKTKDDAEGLSFDSTTGNLLVSGKEPPKIDDKRDKKKRAIYMQNLNTEKIDTDPYLLIDMGLLKNVYISQSKDEQTLRRAEKFKPDSKKNFKPSDLAVHPVNDHVYMIASQGGQLLIVIDRQANILYVREIPKVLLRQIEGIDFSPSGDMYIVSEADGKKATLAIYKNKL